MPQTPPRGIYSTDSARNASRHPSGQRWLCPRPLCGPQECLHLGTPRAVLALRRSSTCLFSWWNWRWEYGPATHPRRGWAVPGGGPRRHPPHKGGGCVHSSDRARCGQMPGPPAVSRLPPRETPSAMCIAPHLQVIAQGTTLGQPPLQGSVCLLWLSLRIHVGASKVSGVTVSVQVQKNSGPKLRGTQIRSQGAPASTTCPHGTVLPEAPRPSLCAEHVTHGTGMSVPLPRTGQQRLRDVKLPTQSHTA